MKLSSFRFKDAFDELKGSLRLTQETQMPRVAAASSACVNALKSGGKILWMGNGGCAAIAQHLSAELVGGFGLSEKPLPSISLTTDTSVLTALGNDFGFKTVFSKQLEALASPGDVVMGMSTSGRSDNVLEGMKSAMDRGIFTVGWTGEEWSPMFHVSDILIKIPSKCIPRVQELMLFLGHCLCDTVVVEMMSTLPDSTPETQAFSPPPSNEQLSLPPTNTERAESWKQINKLHLANRFRLMFGQPLLSEEPPPSP